MAQKSKTTPILAFKVIQDH